MMQNITPVSWSFCGRVGKLFVSEDALYRTIVPEWADFYKQLFDAGIIQKLIEQGLFVDSELISKSVDNGGLLVKHRRIPFVSYCFEWCDEMFKDAALFFIRFNLELLKFKLMVRDAHPWNIVFDATKPVFVDLGSIVPDKEVNLRAFMRDFDRFFLQPLRLFATGHHTLARLFLREWRPRAWEDFIRLTHPESGLIKIYQFLKQRTPTPVKRAVRFLQRVMRSQQQTTPNANIWKMLDTLQQQVEEIRIKNVSQWPDYYDTYFSYPEFTSTAGWNSKQIAVAEFLDRTRPKSVLDIGSNRGWYSELAARRGSIVIAFDFDEGPIRNLYLRAKQYNLPILPLVMDFVWPSPGLGLLDFWPAATERLKADFVMALALVHHLVHSEAMWFEHIVQGLSRFTKRWLLVEFVPYEDPLLSKWHCHRYDWYNLEQFIATLRECFTIVEMKISYPLKRILILCERRQL